MTSWTVLGIPIDSVGAPAAGPPVGTERSPAALRALGLVAGLGARDAGDLDVRITGPHRDRATGLVGGTSVAPVVSAVRSAVAGLLRDGERPLLVGGCCTLLVGGFRGASDVVGPLGLAYADGHLDLYDHRTSPTGEVADMPVALLLGHGEPGLLAASAPPALEPARLRVLGARDQQERADVGALAERLGIVNADVAAIAADPAGVGRDACEALSPCRGIWLSLDVDVLDEAAFPATDYLMPGGLSLDQLRELLLPLARSGSLVGASVACYNPSKDPDGRHGAALVGLLADVLGVAT